MRDRRRDPRWWMAGVAVVAAVVAAVAGCGKPPGRVFPPPAKPTVWPPPPERAPHPVRRPVVYQRRPQARRPDHPGHRRNALRQGGGLFHAHPLRPVHRRGRPPVRRRQQRAGGSRVQPEHRAGTHAGARPTGRSGLRSPWESPTTPPAGCSLPTRWPAAFTNSTDGTRRGVIGAGVVVRPCGLAFDVRRKQLFVADAGAHRVFVFSQRGNLVTRIGSPRHGSWAVQLPHQRRRRRRRQLYVCDSLNFRDPAVLPDLKPLRQIGRKGDMPGYFSQPKGVAVDSEDHLYVVDANFETVQIFNDRGRLLLDFGEEGQRAGRVLAARRDLYRPPRPHLGRRLL